MTRLTTGGCLTMNKDHIPKGLDAPISSRCIPAVSGDVSISRIARVVALPEIVTRTPPWCLITAFPRPAYTEVESPLVLLADHQEIWDRICGCGSGNSIMCLTNVKPFRVPTRLSPAFFLLSGRDQDNYLVPWWDRANVLQYDFKGSWNPKELFSLKMFGAFALSSRHMQAIQAADVIENEHDLPMAPPWSVHYTCGGPARPSSPVIATLPVLSLGCSKACAKFVGPVFCYALPNPCENDWRWSDLAPPVFPQDEHRREYKNFLRRSFESPEDESESQHSSSDDH